MARVKRGVHAAKKRRTTLERASGYRGQRSRLFTKAKEQVTHSLVYAFNDRKDKKGDFRQLWIPVSMRQVAPMELPTTVLSKD